MIEADNHLKLLPTSILDIYNVFEHIAILLWAYIYILSSLTQLYSPYLAQILGFSDIGVESK